MFNHLQIADPRERWLVGLADAALAAGAAALRLAGRPRRGTPRPARVLLLRLERIGDLLMAGPAIRAVRAIAPEAAIDLVVGSWNAPMANLLAAADRVETLDVPWLARGRRGARPGDLARATGAWRSRCYDIAINFEGDIRSNLLLGFSGAGRRVGFGMAGGGALLTDVVPHDPRRHVGANALRLVECAFDLPPGRLTPALDESLSLLSALPAAAVAEADRLLAPAALAGGPLRPRYVGLHPGGDREIKRWATDRFAEVGRRLARRCDAAVVLTGSEADRGATGEVTRRLGGELPVLDLAGRTSLVTLAALIARMEVFVTGDTGPMHLAAALDVPLVALFGPSDPARWGPLSAAARTVRVQIPCSPCNRIRRPPPRCLGHVPDCLAGIDVEMVWRAAVAAIEGHAGHRLQRTVG